MRKSSLNRKVLSGFIACTIVLITVAVISFNNSSRFSETSRMVNHTRQVLYELENVLVTSVNAETGMRGFIITGQEAFLEPYEAALSSITEHLEKFRELTKDNPLQQENLRQIRYKLDDHLDYMERCIKIRKQDFAQAVALISTGEGKRLHDAIRTVIRTARESEERILEEREQENTIQQKNFILVFIILLFVIVLVLLVVFFMINANLRALNKAQRETEERNWSLNGSLELGHNIEGNQTIPELSEKIISHLVRYLGAHSGLFYKIDKHQPNKLLLKAAYAADPQKKKQAIVELGEGLVGQVATSRQHILLTNVSKDDYYIETGFGDIRPRNILAMPFIHEDQVVGVVEIASMNEFTELHIQYLQSVMSAIGLAIVAARGREEIKELLEETQRQSEELQAQQEELKQSNEELIEKTELLERSEAELKAQQEELQQSNEELEEQANLLEEQKEKLENAKIELETRARELEITGKYKSDFLANMSHELRTPLNSILILSQLMAENKTQSLGPKEVEFASNIYKSGADLLTLINEILDLSKIEAGKLELDIENVPINEVITDVERMFSEMARQKSIRFSIQCDEQIKNREISTDLIRLEQIVKNLLSNAFKFTPKGGQVTFSIGKANEELNYNSFAMNNAGDIIYFSVSDNGIGIPESKRALIFEAFQQADGSTKRKYGGTGLGLSISRELVYALGGEIRLESEEGKGSTFTVYLPVKFDSQYIKQGNRIVEVKESTVAIREELQTQPANFNEIDEVHDDRYNIRESDRVILIMEDDRNFYTILLDFVRKRKYKGIVATQGNTGLSYARFYKPDAILLDMKLPMVDGLEVLKQLKSDSDLRHIPVQIISAMDYKKKGLAMGAFDYMSKPVTMQDLQMAFDKIENFSNKKLKKLLVIEDNVEHNKVIRDLVGNGDVKSFPAYTGSESMDMLQKDDYDCIILDLGLPDISGFDLLEKIKTIPRLNKIPVVVYTGRDLNPQEAQRLNKLADTVVLKTANSTERLLDETALFLHRVESRLPQEKQSILRKLHKADEVLKGKKVLIVDDDIRNIYSLVNALESEGVNCLVAENGRLALNELDNDRKIDMVLLDIMMPEMDGYETIEVIRKTPGMEKLPVIALTAKAMKGDREKCLAAGMSDYISKPVNIEQLLSLMRVWLYK